VSYQAHSSNSKRSRDERRSHEPEQLHGIEEGGGVDEKAVLASYVRRGSFGMVSHFLAVQEVGGLEGVFLIAVVLRCLVQSRVRVWVWV